MTPSSILRMMLVLGLLSSVPLHSATREFKQLVKELRIHCHKAPIGTGFLGFMARCFSPEGVSGLRLAIFEDLEAGDQVSGADFEDLVRHSVGLEVVPLVVVRRQPTGERTLVYAKPNGKRTELLIATAEQQEIVLLTLKVHPALFQHWLNDPGRMAKQARGEKGAGTSPDGDLKGTLPGSVDSASGGDSAPGEERVH